MARVGRRVAIVEGVRTPFAKAGSAFANMTAIQLGIVAVRELLERADIPRGEIDQLVYGTVIPSVLAPNIAREVTLGAGLPPAGMSREQCIAEIAAMSSVPDAFLRRYPCAPKAKSARTYIS